MSERVNEPSRYILLHFIIMYMGETVRILLLSASADLASRHLLIGGPASGTARPGPVRLITSRSLNLVRLRLRPCIVFKLSSARDGNITAVDHIEI